MQFSHTGHNSEFYNSTTSVYVIMDGTSEVPNELRSITGSCPSSFLVCPSCTLKTSVQYINLEGEYSWALPLTCASCQEHWFICTLCGSDKQHTCIPGINCRHRHHAHFHMHPSTQHRINQFHNAMSSEEDSAHDVGYCSDIDVISEVPFSHLLTKALSSPKLLVDTFGNDKSIQYFSAQLMGRGSGAAEIVSCSQFGVSSLAHQLTSSEVSGQFCYLSFHLIFPVI